jgi:hypothetical protein
MNPTYASLRRRYAALAAQFARRRDDLSFERGGGRLIYALDNDVITIATAPWRNLYQRYLHLLIDKDERALESLSYVLADYFLSHSNQFPYVILRPAERELEGMWNHVYVMARDAHEDWGEDLDRKLMRQSIPAGQSEKELFDVVERILNAIYGRQGPLTELRRISRVRQSGAIRRMDTVRYPDGRSPFPVETDHDIQTMAALEKVWLTELNQSLSKNASRHAGRSRPNRDLERERRNNLVDAAVLARLQWINQEYARNGEKVRLCLVTGDADIEKVASQEQFQIDGKSFADEFIRSPTCVLVDDDFFSKATNWATTSRHESGTVSDTGEYPAVSIWEWLDVLFPAGRGGAQVTEAGTSRSMVEQANSALAQWARYLKSITDTSRLDNESIESELKDFADYVRTKNEADVRRAAEDLKSRLGAVAQSAMLQFGATGSLAGFWSLGYSGREMERSIPSVRFDGRGKADNLIRQLRHVASFEHLQRSVDKTWLNILNEDDKSGYTTLIVFALAFASANEWPTALTIARGAADMARHVRTTAPPQSIKGDEAAYLCAVFSRLTARDPTELDEAERWLRLADTLQKTPPIRGDIDPANIEEYLDSRIQCERMAIRLCRRLFSEFTVSERSQDILALSWSPDDEYRKNLLQFDRADSEPEHVQAYVKEQLAVNALQWRLLAMHRNPAPSIGEPDLVRLIGFLHELTRRQDSQGVDGRGFRGTPRETYFIYLCAAGIYMPWLSDLTALPNRAFLLTELNRITGPMKEPATRVMPYDPYVARALVTLTTRFLEATT